MAALPSPTQVAGNHSAIYEALYNYVDPNGYGTVGAMEAARFLKRSGLSDVVLSRVWDLSDPGGRGCLDKSGMFVALKLVALAQAGRDINLSNISLDMPPPKMGDIPLPKPKKPPPPSSTPLITSLPAAAVDWTIKPTEREKYDRLFDSLQPLNGMIPGNKVKGVLMDSKLPLETLGKIWDLADQDKDGMLDRHEFVVAMHLVYKALEKHAIPNTLPPELLPPTKRKGSSPVVVPILNKNIDGIKPDLPPPPSVQPVVPAAVPKPIVPIQPVQPVQTKPIVPPLTWVVSSDEKSKSDALFIKSDIDKDGFVSGQEIKDVFLQSGVPQPILAHIWALCDIKQSGKLNNEQFALAMWLVARCLKGVDPPQTLTPEMVPPSFRTSKPADGIVENNNTCYSNPELDMISKDIEELVREKLVLEAEIAQKEADIKIKSGEIKSLQSELDTLAATLKQLENQKGEAQKRLSDLKAQREAVDKELEAVEKEINEQSEKVDKLRIQANEQAETVAAQEKELMSKKEQLECLRQEEQRLEDQKQESAKKLDQLSSSLQETQLNISQVKAITTQLEEQTRQMNDAITACESALDAGDANLVADTMLKIEPDFRDPAYNRLGLMNGDSHSNQQNGFGGEKNDPFSNPNGLGDSSGFQDDPFKNDPFKNNSDAFIPSDPFNSAFTSSKPAGNDPFNSFGTNTNSADPFSAFGDSRNASITPNEADKDPFGCDPFAVLHAPTRDGGPPGRPTSPSPALPPKKSKQPPPRPAPPRPQPPSSKMQQDPFAAPSSDPFGSNSGFANFADFDSKCCHISSYTDIQCPLSYPPSKNQRRNPNIPIYPTNEIPVYDAIDKFSNKSSSTVTSTTSKSLDFTDDPFRDYRYEDPFNISFDEEPTGFAKSSGSLDTAGISSSTNTNIEESKFDPFGLGSGRQSVPLPSTDSYKSASGRSSVPLNKTELPSEDQQLAWAARESLKLEEVRRQRQIQEQAEIELAIALSKSECKKH